MSVGLKEMVKCMIFGALACAPVSFGLLYFFGLTMATITIIIAIYSSSVMIIRSFAKNDRIDRTFLLDIQEEPNSKPGNAKKHQT